MRKITFAALVAMVAMTSQGALAQTVPPTTVNSPQSTNNGVSNPVGQNTNVQVNNSYAGMNSFGVGIECATPYLAAGLFNNNTNVGGGVGASAANNNSLGGTLQYVVPVGGRSQSNCTELSSEILRQRQLDTQITLIERCADFAKAGIKLDSAVYPQIAAACAGVHVTPGVGLAPSALPTAAPALAQTVSQSVTVPKLVVYREPAPPAKIVTQTCARWSAPTTHQRRLVRQLSAQLRSNKLSRHGAAVAARQLAELQSSCVNPVALINVLAGR